MEPASSAKKKKKIRCGCHIYGKFVGLWMKRCASSRAPQFAHSAGEIENENDNQNSG